MSRSYFYTGAFKVISWFTMNWFHLFAGSPLPAHFFSLSLPLLSCFLLRLHYADRTSASDTCAVVVAKVTQINSYSVGFFVASCFWLHSVLITCRQVERQGDLLAAMTVAQWNVTWMLFSLSLMLRMLLKCNAVKEKLIIRWSLVSRRRWRRHFKLT